MVIPNIDKYFIFDWNWTICCTDKCSVWRMKIVIKLHNYKVKSCALLNGAAVFYFGQWSRIYDLWEVFTSNYLNEVENSVKIKKNIVYHCMIHILIICQTCYLVKVKHAPCLCVYLSEYSLIDKFNINCFYLDVLIALQSMWKYLPLKRSIIES